MLLARFCVEAKDDLGFFRLEGKKFKARFVSRREWRENETARVQQQAGSWRDRDQKLSIEFREISRDLRGAQANAVRSSLATSIFFGVTFSFALRDLLPAVCVACRNTASLHPTVSISNFILKCSGTGSHREKGRERERERDSSLICAEPRVVSSPSTCEGKLRSPGFFRPGPERSILLAWPNSRELQLT